MIYAATTIIAMEVMFLLMDYPFHAISSSIMFVGVCILWASMNLEKK